MCPGGAENSCYGNGICDKSTGVCSCRSGANTQADCQDCIKGWFGADCSIAISDSPNVVNSRYFASVYFSGHFVSFDGVSYNFHSLGEFILLQSKTKEQIEFSIHIRQRISSSYGLGSEIDAVAFKYGSHVIEFYAGLSDNSMEGSVVIDGEWNYVGHSKIIIPKVSISMEEIGVYKISISNEFDLIVTVRGKHFDIQLKAIASYCENAIGLITSCDNKPANDFTTRDGNVLVGGYNGTLTEDSIHGLFGISWKVSTSDTLFKYNPTQDSMIAGYCGYFEETSVIANSLYTFVEEDLVIEMKLKISSNQTNCGSVMSYRNEGVFSLLICNTHYISVHFGKTIQRVSFELESDTWYHIALIYGKSNSDLHVVIIKENGFYVTQAFHVSDVGFNILKPGGSLRVGQWNSLGIETDGLRWNFNGWLDELRIWNKKMSVTDVRNNAWNYVSADAEGLTNYWRFDDGEGPLVRDIVSGVHLQMFEKPWRRLQFVISDVVLKLPSNRNNQLNWKTLSTISKASKTLQTFCYDILFSAVFNETCNILDSSTRWFYYGQCLFNTVLMHAQSASLEVILAAADHCSYMNLLSNWPAKQFCNSFTGRRFPYWIGKSCSTRCLSGHNEAEKCACYDGFWGISCNNVCVSDRNGPCGISGTCDKKTGKCICSNNYQRTTDCLKCAEGWNGNDCSSVQLGENVTPATQRFTSIYGYSHITMFDGQTYDLIVPGDFTFIKSEFIGVYFRQVSCGNEGTKCVISIVIELEKDNITLHTPFGQETELLVFINGISFSFLNNLSHQLFNCYLTFQSKNIVVLQHTSGSVITVRSNTQFLSLRVLAASSICENMKGLSGNCDRNTDNDFVTNQGLVNFQNISREIINGPFAGYFKLHGQGSSRFGLVYKSFKEPSISISGGHDLSFTGSVAESVPLAKTFDDSSDISVEIRVKIPSITKGTLFGYIDKDNIIQIQIDTSVVLVVNSVNYDTHVSPEMQTWITLALSYKYKIGACTFFYVSHSNIFVREFQIGKGLFKSGGTITLGGILPKANHPFSLVPSNLKITIGELCVWKRYLSIYLVLQNYHLRIDTSYPGISGLWEFSEGNGYLTFDHVNGYSINLPVDEGVIWETTDFIEPPKRKPSSPLTKQFNISDPEIKSRMDVCFEIFLKSQLNEACSDLGNFTIQHFYLLCLADVIVQGSDIHVIIDATVSFSTYCQENLNKTNNPLELLCISNASLPFRSDLCTGTENCKFGTLENDGKCQCSHGFWGATCSDICPGSVAKPCNNHGYCDQITGKCVCDDNFDTKDNCSSCAKKWTGHGCSIYPGNGTTLLPTMSTTTEPHTSKPTASTTPSLPVFTSDNFAAVYGLGNVMTYQGTYYQMLYRGEFYLMQADQDQSTSVQIRFTECFKTSLCVTAIGVKDDGDSIIIRASYTTEGMVTVWNNMKIISVDKLFRSKTHVIVRESSHHFTITHIDGKYQLKLRNIGRRLNVLIGVIEEICITNNVLVGGCHETNGSQIPSIEQSKVSKNVSVFTPLFSENLHYHETPGVSGTNYALKLSKGGFISTDPLPNLFFENHDFTICLFFKPFRTSGLILSYSFTVSFCVYYEASLKLQIGKHHYTTNLIPIINEWNELCIVWQSPSNSLTLYHTNSVKEIQYESIFVKEKVIVQKNGVLTIGDWLNPNNADVKPNVESFEGLVDDVKVWKKGFSLLDVNTKRGKHIDLDDIYLTSYWPFDDGEGQIVRNMKTSYHLHFSQQTSSAMRLNWVFSDAPVYQSPRNFFFWFDDVNMNRKANRFCKNLFNQSSVSSACMDLQISGTDGFELACMKEIAASNALSGSLSVALIYADFCESKLRKEAWPGRNLCNLYPSDIYPLWHGKDCDVKCVFGSLADNKHSCRCISGAWGSDCSNICPAGISNPCSGHGSCDGSTGKCKCNIGWDSNEQCSKCAPFWHGSDCSVSIVSVIGETERICVSSQDGHFIAFDGAAFEFKIPGLYLLFKSETIDIEIKQTLCSYMDICISGLALKVKTDILKIFPDPQSVFKVVHNRENTILKKEIILSENLTIKRTSKFELTIVGLNEVFVFLTAQKSYIEVQMRVSKSMCAKTAGICGPCDASDHSCNDDINCLISKNGLSAVLKNRKISQNDIEAYFQTYRRVSIDSAFTSEESVISGYALFINDRGIATKPLKGSSFKTRYISVILRINVKHSPSGSSESVIFSYSAVNTFGITIVNQYFMIVTPEKSIETLIRIGVLQWSQVSLVYDRFSGTLLFQSIVKGVSRYTTVNVGVDHFPVKGTISVGEWQQTTNGELINPAPNGKFSGFVDSLTLWNVRFGPADFIKISQVRIGKRSPGLVKHWSFNEGSGKITKDLLDRDSIRVERDMWNYSTYPINIQHHSRIPAIPSIEYCEKLFSINGDLATKCVQLKSALSYFLQYCSSSVTASGNEQKSFDALISFSMYCKFVLKMNVNPTQSSCQDYPLQQFPYWSGKQCKHRCIYGESDSSQNCKCDHGYWGTHCDFDCEPSAGNPCNNHGVCDQATGKCLCDKRWKGDDICSKCTSGWIGKDCNIEKLNLPAGHKAVCKVGRRGSLTTFAGYDVNIDRPQTYILMKASNLEIQVGF